MGGRFDYFVIYAEMRTGSNFLEENVNEYPGLKCYGEAFNPVFIGGPNKSDLLGVTMAAREADPIVLLDQMRVKTDGLPGFRFFHDHDPRILDKTLNDPRCGKIILTRNPIESYVSRKIAAETGQWRLNDLKNAKTAQVAFNASEFTEHLENLQAFQLKLLRGLQTTGQTAFYVSYEDVQELEVLDGLAAFLGVDHQKSKASKKTKVQNPAPMAEKVENFGEMEQALARLDRFNLNRTPNFEPRRAALVPNYLAAANAPLLFQPIKGGPDRSIRAWLALLDGVEDSALLRDFNRKSLRQWKRQNPGHRCFSVIRHPVKRLHSAFCRYILGTGEDTYWDLREALRKNYNLPVPDGAPGDNWTISDHRNAFLVFARFVQGNLSGQTSLRVDASWASQTEVLQGMSQVQVPDIVLREDDLELGLKQLAEQVSLKSPGKPTQMEYGPYQLCDIYDEEAEAITRSAYQKDYMQFGFRALSKT